MLYGVLQMTEELYDCIVKGCNRHSFTNRGLILHIKAKHPDFYDKWKWNFKPTSIDYTRDASQILDG